MSGGQYNLSIVMNATNNASGAIMQLLNSLGPIGGAAVLAGAAVVGIGVKAVQMAGNFQESMTSLVTGAGESQQNLQLVSDGILNMAVQTGTSTSQLAQGMYMVESAGFHGAAGLQVLQAAAEGAKVGSADLQTVANAVTSALNAYGLQGKDATTVTNELIATVAAGKMHMQDLANALAAVLPVAAAAHISYAQVGGAIATMTMQGMSAQQATQTLANTIRSLQNPNAVAIAEMQAMGLNATEVSQHLGQKGLTGTLNEISQAILQHMGPSGLVLMNTFKSSTVAAQDAKIMMDAMPVSLQKLAQQYMNGSLTAKQWRTDLQGLPPIQQKLMQQFAATADKTHSFNQQLTSGSPAAQTYNAAMAKIMGGATGLNTALMLTGSHMTAFQQNVTSVSKAAKTGGNSIAGWSLVQQNFNFKMAQVSELFEVAMIRLGTALLPVVSDAIDLFITFVTWIGNVITFFQKNQWATDVLVAALGGLAVALIAANAQAILMAIAAIPGLVVGFGAWAVSALAAAAATLLAAAPFILIGVIAAAVILGIILAIQHWGAVVTFFSGLWHTVWGAVSSFFVSVWQHIVSFFVGIWNTIVSFVKAHALLLLAVITGPIGAIVILIVTHWNQIMGFLAGVWAWIVSTAQSLWNDVINIFRTAWTGLSNALNSLLSNIRNWFTGLATNALQWGKDLIQNLINGILSMAGGVVGAVQNIAGKIAGFLHFTKPELGPLASVDEWMPHFGDVLAAGMLSNAGKLSTAAKAMALPIAGGVSSGLAGVPASAASGGVPPSGTGGAVVNHFTIAYYGNGKWTRQDAQDLMDIMQHMQRMSGLSPATASGRRY